MGRRVLLLAALGLAACVADMPTEPTGDPSGLFAVLPPPPAPPVTLTASLPGADGAPVSQELGFYEAPTLAEITVSGLLSYSGMELGYYPGSGVLDYQGRWLPGIGRCASQVTVRIAGVGPVGGGFGSCPGFWESQGTITTYAVVSGELVVDRGSPAPGACFYGGSPCASISGEQTVVVTPLDGDLLITANPAVTTAGGIISAKFTPTPDALHGKGMPYSLREVRFEGSGPILGGGQTTGCTSWSRPNECTFRLYQSGFLVVEGVVSGRLKVTRKWLTMVGGDSVPPPPPPDSTPPDTPPDSVPGGGGGGGGGGCGDCCGDTTAASPQMEACQPPDPPTATVECKGPAGLVDIVRTEIVDCSVIVTPSQTFIVTGWQATPDGGGIKSFPGSPTLTGPAIIATEVGATVALADGTALNATPARFRVASRGWAKLQLPFRAPIVHRYAYDPVGEMDVAPIQGKDFALGAFALADLRFRDLPVLVAAQGPNLGYAYFVTAPAFPTPEIYTHPELRAGPWHTDQNGRREPGTNRPRCEATVFPVLEPMIDIHEGVTQVVDSHWGIAYDIFELSQLTPVWEALVDPSGNPQAIQRAAQGQFDAVARRLQAAQALFDRGEYPRIFGSLGCALDMDQSPADG